MATRKQNTKAAAGPADKGLRIVARPASFWRCGIQFTAEAKTVPLSELTPDQVDTLMEEPMLVVSEVDIAPAADDATT